MSYLIWDSLEYKAIQDVYKGKSGNRTKLPYMRHIDKGLEMLKEYFPELGLHVQKAWCLHPIFQLDEHFQHYMKIGFNWDPVAVALAMEYRRVANSYLTADPVWKPIPLSSIDEVNKLLIVDKVSNWFDARMHLPSYNDRLDIYFKRWLDRLGVSADDRNKYERVFYRA